MHSTTKRSVHVRCLLVQITTMVCSQFLDWLTADKERLTKWLKQGELVDCIWSRWSSGWHFWCGHVCLVSVAVSVITLVVRANCLCESLCRCAICSAALLGFACLSVWTYKLVVILLSFVLSIIWVAKLSILAGNPWDLMILLQLYMPSVPSRSLHLHTHISTCKCTFQINHRF